MSRIIGIDLGTTNSCVAILEGHEPSVLPNAEGTRTTPSVVAFLDDGECLVGQQAKRQAIINPERTISGIKRLIGRSYRSEEVAELRQILPYKIVESVNGDAWAQVEGQDYSPQEISALLLKKIRASAEDYLGEPVTEAVITVPAYFDDSQRQATKDAGRIADLNVRRIINEPTAAALAYGFQHKPNATLAVVDLGGGTFDISILRIAGGRFEVLSTRGDNTLGGDDFDRVITRRLLEEFEDQSGLDITEDKMAVQRLREAAEAAKCELSTLHETNINLPFLAVDGNGARHLAYTLTRAELNDLCLDLVERLDRPCNAALKDAKLTIKDLDDVLLVGGMTRMPLVRERIEEVFGQAPNKGVNPDEVVALGAAVQSALLTGELQEIELTDVTPLALGIRVVGDRMATIIPGNTTLPVRKDKIFTTTEDNQDVVSVVVLQGESDVATENRLLGTFSLTNIPPQPAGAPRIEVSFAIDTDGMVHVSAKDKTSGREHSVVITDHGGLTDEELRRASERVGASLTVATGE